MFLSQPQPASRDAKPQALPNWRISANSQRILERQTNMLVTNASPRPIVWLGDSKQNLRDFPEGAQKLLGMSFSLFSLVVCRKTPDLLKVLAAELSRLPCGTCRTLIESCS